MDIQQAKSLIKDFGLTQQAVARQMGLDPSQLGHLFAGRRKASDLTVATMIAAIYRLNEAERAADKARDAVLSR